MKGKQAVLDGILGRSYNHTTGERTLVVEIQVQNLRGKWAPMRLWLKEKDLQRMSVAVTSEPFESELSRGEQTGE